MSAPIAFNGYSRKTLANCKCSVSADVLEAIAREFAYMYTVAYCREGRERES